MRKIVSLSVEYFTHSPFSVVLGLHGFDSFQESSHTKILKEPLDSSRASSSGELIVEIRHSVCRVTSTG